MTATLGQYYDCWLDAELINPPHHVQVLVTVAGFHDDVPIVQLGTYDKSKDKWTVEFGVWSDELKVVSWAFKPEPAIFPMSKEIMQSGRPAYDRVVWKRFKREFMSFALANILAIILVVIAAQLDLGPFDKDENFYGFMILGFPFLIVVNLITYLIVEKFKDAYP